MQATGTNWKLLDARRLGPPVAVAVVNQKGGVGKTTTSVNLAAALALKGHRVLLVDLDPQCNATTGIGIDRGSVEHSTYDLVLGTAVLGDVTRTTSLANLDCAPASRDLVGAEIELVGELARERKLADALEQAGSRHGVVIIDCPPSLGLLTINAMVAAKDLIVPVQCEYYALEGLGQLLSNADRVRRSLNPELRIGGFIITMYDSRTKLSSEVVTEVRSHFGDLVYSTPVPRSVRLSEAPSYGRPAVALDAASKGAAAYALVAQEMEERYGLRAARFAPASTSAEGPAEPEEGRAVPARGPGGRGYGTLTREPDAVEEAWPRTEPWSDSEEQERDETSHRGVVA